MRSRAPGLILFLAVAVLGAAADQVSKALVFANHELGELTPFVPPLLGILPHWNRGALGGLGSDFPLAIVVVSFLALGVILWLFISAKPHRALTDAALGAMMAGAVGNLIDRLVFGQVRDFIKFLFWERYPVFNLADAFLLVGVLLILVGFSVHRHTCEIDRDAADAKDGPSPVSSPASGREKS